jgi:hypothetical protein
MTISDPRVVVDRRCPVPASTTRADAEPHPDEPRVASQVGTWADDTMADHSR